MTRKTLSNLLAVLGLAIALGASFFTSIAYGRTLTISVVGLNSTQGVLRAIVYNDETAFNQNSETKIAAYEVKDVSSDTIELTIKYLVPGEYAIFFYHDQNTNEVFDMSGETPLEGWAYSNNVGTTSIPSFTAASFQIDKTNAAQTISMNYVN